MEYKAYLISLYRKIAKSKVAHCGSFRYGAIKYQVSRKQKGLNAQCIQAFH